MNDLDPGSAIEAVNRGLTVVIPEDATAATTADVHETAFRQVLPTLATVTSTQEVIDAVDLRRARPDDPTADLARHASPHGGRC